MCKRGCIISLALLSLPVGLALSLLAWRVRWIEPRPGVDLTLKWAVLDGNDMVSGSSHEVFMQILRDSDEGPDWSRATLEISDEGWPPLSLPDLPAQLAKAEATLERLREVLEDPEVRLPEESRLTPYSGGFGILKLKYLFGLVLVESASEGDWERFLIAHDTGLAMAEASSRGGRIEAWILAQSVRSTMSRVVLQAAEGHPIPEATRAALIRRYIRSDLHMPSLAEAFRVTAHVDLANHLRDPGQIWKEMPLFRRLDAESPLSRTFGFLKGSQSFRIAANMESLMQHVVHLVEAPEDPARWSFVQRIQNLDDRVGLFKVEDPVGFQYATMILSVMESSMEWSHHGQFTGRATAAVLAVQAYQKDHSELPPNLDGVVGTYLPSDLWPGHGGTPRLRLNVGGGGWSVVSDRPVYVPGGRPWEWKLMPSERATEIAP